MPGSPPDSTGSPPPSAMPSPSNTSPAEDHDAGGAADRPSDSPGRGRDPRGALVPLAGGQRTAAPLAWRTNAWLFIATVASAFLTRMRLDEPPSRAGAVDALQYTAALMAILLAHEFGHYIAARIHRVDASLPYFIPLPFVSPFGTMGAVIRMRSVIPTRRALLDIGAAGPLAGLALAIPLYAWGVAHSKAVAMDGSDGDMMQLGSSVLLRLLDRGFAPFVPEGMDVLLSPVAFAAWVGMFVTMINLLPVGQLDGGHVAYALFGSRQNTVAQWVHRSMLAFFLVSLTSFVARDVRAGMGLWHIGRHVNNSLFWLVWFEVVAVLGTLSTARGGGDSLGVRTRAFAILGLALLAGIFRDRSSPVIWGAWFAGLAVLVAMEVRWGALRPSSILLDHPETGAEPLRRGRVAIAILTLAFFALLFMPTPLAL
jgi:membrane-associated protease RseP (regulator of RpoE activity)